jgi:hypothetical protein
VAAVPLAAAVGRLRGFDLRDDLGGLLVHRHGSRLRHLRDRQVASLPVFLRLLSLGWRGSVRHWMRYETASLLLAGLATPLVLSVHTVISFDFAVAVLPGWHTTIFPPYFVAGAIYSGFAMVLTLAIPLRKFYHLEDLVTERHIDNMGKVMLGRASSWPTGTAWKSSWLVLGLALGILHDVEPHVRADGLVVLGADLLQHRVSADDACGAQAADEYGFMFF